MKRFPLQTLVMLRMHRTALARQQLLVCQREAHACRAACADIEGEIGRLQSTQREQRARMLAPAPGMPPGSMPGPAVLSQRESHIELLGEQAMVARQRLVKAQEALRAAEHARDEARAAFFRARARQDALEKRGDAWRDEQRMRAVRHEEGLADDLLQAAHVAGAHATNRRAR